MDTGTAYQVISLPDVASEDTNLVLGRKEAESRPYCATAVAIDSPHITFATGQGFNMMSIDAP